MVDFEKALQTAISTCWKDCVIRGCFFHFKQSIRRWCKDNGMIAEWDNSINEKITSFATSSIDPTPKIEGKFFINLIIVSSGYINDK